MKSRSQQAPELSFLVKFFLSLYSILVATLVQICALALKLKIIQSNSLKRQMQDRPLTSREFIDKLRSNKFFNSNKKLGIFFCSSAGEYEQAKPLIDRCIQAHMQCLVIFFSRSGLEFALSQNAARRSTSEFFLLSIPDLYFHWQKILMLLQAQFVCVVRHELWPGLIYAACINTNLQIINVEFGKIRLSSIIKITLLKRAQKIYCVDEETKQRLLNYGVPIEKLRATGDTKYDRVLERSKQHNLNHLQSTSTESFILIVGSAWPADIEVVIPTFKDLIEQSSAVFPWRVIIAPHEISPNMIKKIERILLDHNLGYSIETDIDLNNSNSPITVIQSMGKLAELYALSQIAFVGGAMHHRVHNVLEPACYGNSIAFGPNYHTSPEASAMVRNSIATVINSSQELKTWWLKEHERLSLSSDKKRNQASVNFVKSLAGSSNLIFDDLITQTNTR